MAHWWPDDARTTPLVNAVNAKENKTIGLFTGLCVPKARPLCKRNRIPRTVYCTPCGENSET
jgi:hypothetical protein